MAKPYALLADLHCHSWSAFATTDADGVNSRLKITMDEFERAAKALVDAGGNTLVIAGDLFHQRGSIDPEVFNYVQRRIKETIETFGIDVVALPGNHDLKGRETTELGNAFSSLEEIEHFYVISKSDLVTHAGIVVGLTLMVPWCSTKEGLLSVIEDTKARYAGVDWKGRVDLIIHWGIDGVLDGMPEHGTAHHELEALGFKRVFAGHYHNHKIFEGGKVISIGATTHQKWSDIGTRAGFLLVYDDRVEFNGSHAPNFVEITGDTDPDDVPLIVDGNFVRVASMKLTDAQISTMRQELRDMGAKGVVFQVARETVSARTGEAMKAKTLGEAVDDYITTTATSAGLTAGIPELQALCGEILTEAQTASD